MEDKMPWKEFKLSVNGEGFTSCMLTAQESLSNNVV